jgi:hypothetical protein
MSDRTARPRTRLGVECLEDRLTPSFGSTPPATITPPAAFTAVALDANGDASGAASITANENDFYRFTAAAGTYTFTASTPNSTLDTVAVLYTAAGQRVAFNDDISTSNRDSRFGVSLQAGTYFLAVSNYVGTAGGSYTWGIDGPAAAPPSQGGFQIALRTSGLTATQQAVFQQAASRWAQVITGDLPDATYNGVFVDDLLIDASVIDIDGVGGTLGQAGPDRVRSGTLLPIHGTMQFDRADIDALERNGGLFATVLHEMGHVLGIGTIWQQRGLVTGAGTSNPRFVGPQATAAYNQRFGVSAAGVPLETAGGAGTRDSHFRESVFGNELMTGFLNSGSNPLSAITVGSLADLGYQVNFAAADPY